MVVSKPKGKPPQRAGIQAEMSEGLWMYNMLQDHEGREGDKE